MILPLGDGTAYDPKLNTCKVCGGSGGWDTSRDIEVYNAWIDCEICDGTGEVDYDD